MLQQLAQGSQEAFTRLFLQYKDRIFHITRLYTKDSLVAEEILQEVFLTIWVRKEQAATISDFKSWVFIVTRNRVIKYLQKWANTKLLEQSWATDNPEKELVAKEYYGNASQQASYEQYVKLLEEAVNLLPTQQQTVFKLAKEENLSYQAIAEQLSISPLTVKTHMQRAFFFIRKHFSEHGGGAFSVLLAIFAQLEMLVK